MIYSLHADSKETEALLCEKFKSGDKKSFEDVYRLYYPKLYNYGCKFTPDSHIVEDSIQEIFIWCWFNRQKLLEIKSVKNYLFVAFRHELLKIIRTCLIHTDLSSSEEEFTLELAVDMYFISKEILNEQQNYLENALISLTSRQREVIFLKFFENMTYEDISKILNISIKATYKLLGRAIKLLRQYAHSHQQPVTSIIFPLIGTALSVFL